MANSFNPDQPAPTAQADLIWNCLQMHQAPLSQKMTHLCADNGLMAKVFDPDQPAGISQANLD